MEAGGDEAVRQAAESAAVMRDAVREHVRLAFRALRTEISGLEVGDLNRAPGPDMNSLVVLVHHTIETARSILLDVVGQPTPRAREAAFRVTDASEADLQRLLESWDAELEVLLERALATDLNRTITRFREASVAWWLVQVLVHTREHAAHAAMTHQMVTRHKATGR